MESLIVTGGAGFIGSNFVRYFRRRTDRPIIVVDKLSYAGSDETFADLAADPRVTLVRGDIANGAMLGEVFAEHRPGAVVNFAAETHVDRSIEDPFPFLQSNVVGTVHLLEASRRFWQTLDAASRDTFRFVQVSTDEVYGTVEAEGGFSESTAYAPNSPYAASKASADHFVRAYHRTYGFPAVITNCSNNYGPYQYPEKLIPLMLLRGLDGETLPIYGDGGQVRDWLHVEDHCEALGLVLSRAPAGSHYNIGGGAELRNVEVVDKICNALEALRPARGNPRLVAHGVVSYLDLKRFVQDRPGHDRHYAIDSRKIRSELGWSPSRDFDQGLHATVRWYLDNMDWCNAVQGGFYGRERLGLGRT